MRENLSLENLSLEEYFKRTAEIIDKYVGEDWEEQEEEGEDWEEFGGEVNV